MAENPQMSPAEFQDLIDRFGVQPAQWPAHERGRAESLLENSADARAMLAEGKRLKEAFAACPPKAPEGLADRIVGKALGERDKS